MSDKLKQSTERLNTHLDAVSVGMDQVFLDMNSVFKDMDDVFNELGKQYSGEELQKGVTVEQTTYTTKTYKKGWFT